MLGIDGGKSKIIDFLCSPKGEEIMQEISLSIHLETGNIFIITLILKRVFMIFY